MTYVDPETKRAGYEKLAKLGLIALAAAVSAPLAYMALEGLLLWGAVAVTVALAWNFSSPFAQWMANKRIVALKAVIEANPIETMKNIEIEKTNALNIAETKITDFETSLNNFHTKVETFKVKYPSKADAYAALEDKMRDCLTGMRQQQRASVKALAIFHDKIEEAEAIYDMSQSANTMVAKSQAAQQDVYQKIKIQIAFDKVQSDLNHAFASLNTAMERRNNLMAAEHPEDETPKELPAPAVHVEEISTVGMKSGIPLHRS